jgi:hypothetical protein
MKTSQGITFVLSEGDSGVVFTLPLETDINVIGAIRALVEFQNKTLTRLRELEKAAA